MCCGGWIGASEPLPGGQSIPMGSQVLVAGGYLNDSNIERLADSAASDLAKECVDNTYGEIAVVNNQPDVIVGVS